MNSNNDLYQYLNRFSTEAVLTALHLSVQFSSIGFKNGWQPFRAIEQMLRYMKASQEIQLLDCLEVLSLYLDLNRELVEKSKIEELEVMCRPIALIDFEVLLPVAENKLKRFVDIDNINYRDAGLSAKDLVEMSLEELREVWIGGDEVTAGNLYSAILLVLIAMSGLLKERGESE